MERPIDDIILRYLYQYLQNQEKYKQKIKTRI